MTNPPLNSRQVIQSLADLNAGLRAPWISDRQRLCKDFVFGDFRQALAFMVAVGEHAVALDHHPEWRNVYNRVWIELTTHSAGGLTELDFALAQRIEDVHQSMRM